MIKRFFSIQKIHLTHNNTNIVMRVGVRGGAMSYANTAANRRANRVGQTYATAAAAARTPVAIHGIGVCRTLAHHDKQQPHFYDLVLNNNVEAVQDGFVTDYKDQLDKELSR